jgi:hypothetical protein
MNQHRIAGPVGLAAAATMAMAIAGIAPANAAPHTSSASVAGGVLSVTGSNGGDTVVVDFGSPDSVGVEVDGQRESFARSTFRSISVSLGSGDDSFRVISSGSALEDTPLNVTGGAGQDSVVGGAGNDVLRGGDGDDRLLGGAGADALFGDRGDDFVNGQVGTDSEVLGSGDDVAGWLPGEGSDAIFGGSGRDTLAFTGAGGDEVMSLSANGDRAVFLRSPGSVRMDLDDVERLEVDTVGGLDAVTVNDLSGTDLDEAVIGLGGAADTKDDTVTVNGTEQADQIAVGAQGGAVDVSGLQPQTVITGSRPTDRLDINARGGSDQVDVSDAAKALIGVLVDFGQ